MRGKSGSEKQMKYGIGSKIMKMRRIKERK